MFTEVKFCKNETQFCKSEIVLWKIKIKFCIANCVSVNRFLIQDWLPAVSSCSSTISLSSFLFMLPKIRLIASMPLLVVFGLVFLWGGLVGSLVCVFRHGVRHLRLAKQSQSVNCDFTYLYENKKKIIIFYEWCIWKIYQNLLKKNYLFDENIISWYKSWRYARYTCEHEANCLHIIFVKSFILSKHYKDEARKDICLQYIGQKFVDKTICSEEFQN